MLKLLRGCKREQKRRRDWAREYNQILFSLFMTVSNLMQNVKHHLKALIFFLSLSLPRLCRFRNVIFSNEACFSFIKMDERKKWKGEKERFLPHAIGSLLELSPLFWQHPTNSSVKSASKSEKPTNG